MGGAIAEGLIKGDYIDNGDICVADPSRVMRDKFANMGITATPSNQLAAQGADVVCVVVKPWLVEQVLKGIKDPKVLKKAMGKNGGIILHNVGEEVKKTLDITGFLDIMDVR